jgi:hypothetical protein
MARPTSVASNSIREVSRAGRRRLATVPQPAPPPHSLGSAHPGLVAHGRNNGQTARGDLDLRMVRASTVWLRSARRALGNGDWVVQTPAAFGC